MNENERAILELYIEENKIWLSCWGKLLSMEDFEMGVEDSIGWEEVRRYYKEEKKD